MMFQLIKNLNIFSALTALVVRVESLKATSLIFAGKNSKTTTTTASSTTDEPAEEKEELIEEDVSILKIECQDLTTIQNLQKNVNQET